MNDVEKLVHPALYRYIVTSTCAKNTNTACTDDDTNRVVRYLLRSISLANEVDITNDNINFIVDAIVTDTKLWATRNCISSDAIIASADILIMKNSLSIAEKIAAVIKREFKND